MRMFAASGRRQQALGQYHELRAALRRELEAEPDPQTARLYRALLRGQSDPDLSEVVGEQGTRSPHAQPAERARHNLPVALTSFIGRERELREVARLLDRHRLVTLTGAGGSGTTRLAVEAATARVRASRDGVWLVELAGLCKLDGPLALVTEHPSPAAQPDAGAMTTRPMLKGLDG